MTRSVPRAARDACPTVLDLHEAADGHLARVRLPGGLLWPEQLRALAQASLEHGDGELDITSRGNVQLRGLTADVGTALACVLAACGLFHDPRTDRARNITCSPFAGDALVAAVHELDDALIDSPVGQQLSGRFLFCLDDGSDTAGAGSCDVGLFGDELVVGGRRTGRTSTPAGLLEVAGAFLEAANGAPGVWRVRDLPDASALVGAGEQLAMAPVRTRPGLDERSGRTVVGTRLGRIGAAALDALLSAVDPDVLMQLTAHGRVILRGSADGLSEVGLITTDDPWLDVSACAGLGCSKALIDSRAMATPREDGRPVHYAACDRKCGQPFDAVSVTP